MGADWEPQKPVFCKDGFYTRVTGRHHGSLQDSLRRPYFVSTEFGSGRAQHRLHLKQAGVYRRICVCPAQSIFSLAVLVAFHAMLSSILFHQSPCVIPAPQQPVHPLTINTIFSILLPYCSPNRFPNQQQEKEAEGEGRGGGGKKGRERRGSACP